MFKYLAIILISCSSTVFAGQPMRDCSMLPMEAVNLTREDVNDHQIMIQKLLPLAEKGSGTAQHFLASRLLEFDPGQALAWARLSAENGCFEGATLVAHIYRKGVGVTQNYKEAFKWYLLAAEAGDLVAASMVSHMYYEGEGVDKNEEKALYWLHVSRGDS